MAFLATVGVYGIVAFIVRLDDMGYALMRLDDGDGKGFFISVGRFMVSALPWVIRSLSVIGTLAMLLVAGGIFLHHVHVLHEILSPLPSLMGELVLGLTIGSVAVGLHEIYGVLRGR